MDRFDICHPITAKWEGGWSDHPADPGGKTMYGVTEAVYHAWLKAQGKPAKPVRNITMAEALAIYRQQYWNPTAGRYNLRPGVDLATYDASVNAGVSRGIKWMLASVGGADHVTVQKICKARLSFKQGLAIWKTFGKGWANRVADIEAKGVAMALAAAGTVTTPKPHLEAEGAKAKQKANYQDAGGAASGGGGAVTVGTDQIDPAAGWTLAVLVVLAIGVAAFLIWRARINRARAAAYDRTAMEIDVAELAELLSIEPRTGE